MNNKHLIKALKEILRNVDDDGFPNYEAQDILDLILSEKKDLINKIKQIMEDTEIPDHTGFANEHHAVIDFQDKVLSQLEEVKE